MGEFEKQMMQFARDPNLGKGFITASAAELMATRTKATSETLSNVSRGLSMLDDNILTTDEQLKELKNSPEGREQLSKLGDDAVVLQARTLSIVDRQQKFGEEYNKGMMALSLIGGDDADRGFKMLGMKKEDMLKRFDTLRQLPIENLKYKVLRNTFDFGLERIGKLRDDKVKMGWINKIKGYMMQDGNPIHSIRGGDYNTYSPAEQARHDKLITKTVTEAMEQFPDLPKELQGLVGDAFRLATVDLGNEFRFSPLTPNKDNKDDNDAYLQEYKNITDAFHYLKAVDQRLTPLMKNQPAWFYDYIKDGTVPIDDGMDDTKQDLSEFKRIIGLVDPSNKNGTKYWDAMTLIKSKYPEFNPDNWDGGTPEPINFGEGIEPYIYNKDLLVLNDFSSLGDTTWSGVNNKIMLEDYEQPTRDDGRGKREVDSESLGVFDIMNDMLKRTSKSGIRFRGRGE